MKRVNQLLTILILLVFASAGWFLIVRTILIRQGYPVTSRAPGFRTVGALQDFEPVPTLPPLLERDPLRTDRGDNGDTVNLKLTANIPEGHTFAGGEVFTVRILASPKYRGQPNNMMHLESIRFPIRYDHRFLSLKVLPAGAGVRLDDTDLSEECSFYELAEPTVFTISNLDSFNSFYFHKKFPRDNPRYSDLTKGIQLQPNTCIGEVKFQVIRRSELDPGQLTSPFISAKVMIPNVAREIGLDGRGPEGTNPDGTLIGNIDLNEHYNWQISNGQVVGTFALGDHLIPPQGTLPPDPTSTITPTSPPGATSTPTPTGSAPPGDFTWTQVSSTAGTSWYTMKFVNANIGYVVGGADWNGDPNVPVKIAKTTNGGSSWTVSNVSTLRGWARGFDCKDANTCWIVSGGSGRSIIMMTQDGGGTWQDVTRDDGWPAWLWSAAYTGMSNSVVVGTTGYTTLPDTEPDRKMSFIFSQDGTTFNSVPYRSSRSSDEYVVYDISCPLPGTCFAAAKNSLYTMTGNGQTWGLKLPPQSTRYFGLDCLDSNKCWEVGEKIVSTADGGTTWNTANFPGQLSGRPRLFEVDMVNATNGYAVGCSDAPTSATETCAGPGIILKTTDGASWAQVNAPSTGDLTDIHAFDMNNVFVADFSGKIWHGVRSGAAQAKNYPVAMKLPERSVSQPMQSSLFGLNIGAHYVDAQGVPPTPTPYYIDMPPQNAQWPLLWVDTTGELTYTVPIDYDLIEVQDNDPDLTVVSMELYSDPTVETCTIELQTTIKNIGQTPAGQFTVQANGQTYRMLTPVAPGEEKTLRFSDYRHGTLMDPNRVFVDSTDEVSEVREDNNILERYLFLGSIANPACQTVPPPGGGGGGSTGTITGSSTITTVPIDMSKVNLSLKVKLQGIRSGTFSSQYSHLRFAVAVGKTGAANTQFATSDFIHKGNGVYEGVVTFDPTQVPSGSTYKILVKGPKHLAKRFCSADASGSSYFCPENGGTISLAPGLTAFDFSTVLLAPGDLPLDGQQDGIVDSSDLTFIRQNLPNKQADQLRVGDLNFDGIIDTQDFSLVVNNLINNEDER